MKSLALLPAGAGDRMAIEKTSEAAHVMDVHYLDQH
jgi:hypothetical protein